MQDSDWHEGGCMCGEVRYRVRGDSVWKAGCTCNSCARAQSSPIAVWAGFDRDNFEILAGEPTGYRSSPHVIRTFCPTCGATLTYEKVESAGSDLAAAAALVYIASVSLDDPMAYPPDEVVFARDKVGWFELSDLIPHHHTTSPTASHLQFEGVGRDPDAD